MSNRKSSKLSNEISSQEMGWDDVLKEAKFQLKRAKKRGANLELAIRTFQQRVRDKAHFPSCRSTQN
jgi:hypothetical protein